MKEGRKEGRKLCGERESESDMGDGGGMNEELKLVGYKNFKRHNPRSDKFQVKKFHHVEFWCADATSASKHFRFSLGMTAVAKQDLTTGSVRKVSHVLKSNELVFVFTAPMAGGVDFARSDEAGFTTRDEHGFCPAEAERFVGEHGLAVRAIGIEVADADTAFRAAVKNGAEAVLEPTIVRGRTNDADDAEKKGSETSASSEATIAEVKLYGDVVMRFVSTTPSPSAAESGAAPSCAFLPHYTDVEDPFPLSYGIQRLDHAVGNVPKLIEAVNYIARFTGFHEFAEFTAEDVGTLDSGLNSMVLSSNNEMVLLPVNEPTFGTPRKSQIQTYLEFNNGAGLQHLALMTNDIFETLTRMRQCSHIGGFEFMPRASDAYYEKLPQKVGDVVSLDDLQRCKELGILVDKDDQGVLLQIFTKPLGDRPTVFIEIIQRVGCMYKAEDGTEQQKGGCGGFGKGNFSELFKRIEDFEREFKC